METLAHDLRSLGLGLIQYNVRPQLHSLACDTVQREA